MIKYYVRSLNGTRETRMDQTHLTQRQQGWADQRYQKCGIEFQDASDVIGVLQSSLAGQAEI